MIPKTQIPGFFCSDPEVQEFCEEEAWNIGPYSQPEFVMGGREMFAAARAKFGDMACWDLVYWLH